MNTDEFDIAICKDCGERFPYTAVHTCPLQQWAKMVMDSTLNLYDYNLLKEMRIKW